MKFADTKRSPNKTIVFFPMCLAGSLDNALRKENLTGWKIVKNREARETYGVECPKDANGLAAVSLYADMPGTTNQVRALVSDFDVVEILAKIYKLHDDPDAIAYRSRQAGLVQKTIDEDGLA